MTFSYFWQIFDDHLHAVFFAGSPAGQPHLVHGGREQRWVPLQLRFLLCADARLRRRPGFRHHYIVMMACQQIPTMVETDDIVGFCQRQIPILQNRTEQLTCGADLRSQDAFFIWLFMLGIYWELPSLPSHDYHQNVIAGPGGDYYCDANHVNDNWSVITIIILECNKHYFPHICIIIEMKDDDCRRRS